MSTKIFPNKPLLCIVGPTACGKTKLAVNVAEKLDGEILSADSRQVYRDMTIGTGKDLGDYHINGKTIPAHLIDIANAGEQYNVFLYQQDFYRVYDNVLQRGKLPVCCGGSGMYVEAILKAYRLDYVPENKNFRLELEQKSHEELVAMLSEMKVLHNVSDTKDRQRLVRAIEIACHSPQDMNNYATYNFDYQIFYINADREQLRKKIAARLKERFGQGMIEEVQNLINRGLTMEQLKYYGLEYKFIAQYLNHELSLDDMKEKLCIAIGQFAKRQQTWFNRMKKQGFDMIEIDMDMSLAEKTDVVISQWQQFCHTCLDK
ncbi:MAG: tRNA (adenosine(37)-N6)-dimethylallyltransferase MiaA [Bacteroidales bacterium]|nr:tRNA (adenosine(37)-N6)-dimethylallyltransferase MiaA [Bacteroidales bacterium]